MNETVELSLPSGYMLESYRIERTLGNKGGFGITYLATDTALGRKVAIKELLPAGIVTRTQRGVVPQNSGTKDTWEWALNSFRKEAQILAGFQHPNIVHVVRLLDANGTTYLVMEYLEGRNLAAVFHGRAPLPANEFRHIFSQVLDGLEAIHGQRLIHRDIKPDNIYLTAEGRVIILDFGAARPENSTNTTALTQLIVPGYSPFEQYQSRGKLGPASDVYSAAATMVNAITGKIPPQATDRVTQDTWLPLARRFHTHYPAKVLQAIDKALAVRAADRPQTVAEWRTLLGWEQPGTNAAPAGTKVIPLPNRPPLPPPPPLPVAKNQNVRIAAVAAVLCALAGAAAVYVATKDNSPKQQGGNPAEPGKESVVTPVPITKPPPPTTPVTAKPATPPAGNTPAKVIPVISSFTLDDDTLTESALTVVRWEVKDATRLFISPFPGIVSGNRYQFPAPSTDTTYTLTAEGLDGKATKTVTLKIGKAPEITTFEVPSSHTKGFGPVTVRWEVLNATKVTLDGQLCQANGSRDFTVTSVGDRNFEIVAANEYDERTRRSTVTVKEDPDAAIKTRYEAKVNSLLKRDLEVEKGEDPSLYTSEVVRSDKYGRVPRSRHSQIEKVDNAKYDHAEYISHWVELLPRSYNERAATITARQHFFYQKIGKSDRTLYHDWCTRDVVVAEIDSATPKIQILESAKHCGRGKYFYLPAAGTSAGDVTKDYNALCATLRSKAPTASGYGEGQIYAVHQGRLSSAVAKGAGMFLYPVSEVRGGKSGTFLMAVVPATNLK